MDLNQIKIQLQNNYQLVFDRLDMKYEVIGDNLYSTCPIHHGSDNPRAFSYSIQRGYWKCWTRDCQCDHKNDIFGLIKGVLSEKNGKDLQFSDVLKWSCDLLQVKKVKQSKIHDITVSDDITDQILSIFCNSETYKQQNLNIEYNPNFTHEYFTQRGFKIDTLKHFDVGTDTKITSMKDRVIVPIHDKDGQNIVGLIGRSVKEYKLPKFLLYPKGFDKRYYLYNYHRAIQRASETSCLFITEGQGDVWRLYEAGVMNAVSIFGKTIAKEQEDILYKLPITHLIILTDNDQAGRESKIQIKRQFNRMYKLSFPKIYGKDIGDMSVEQIQTKILNNLKGAY